MKMEKTMIKIAICDDSLTDRIVLEKLIRKYCNNSGTDVSIEGYHSAEILIEACDREEYDLVFMDIFLGGMQGNEAARILLKNEKTCVVFTTGSVEYALEGFEIGVFHYVVKPYSYEKIMKSMDKYVKTYHVASYVTVTIKPVGNEPDMELRQNEIYYIESFDKIRCLHMKACDVRTYMTMNELERILQENIFCRPHRSYIVNMAYVTCLKKNEIILDTGDIIPVSRGMQDDIMEKYRKFKGV